MNRVFVHAPRPLGALAALGLLALLAGCANYPANISPGMSRSEVIARFGAPSVDVTQPDHEVLVYSTAPFGEKAFAARLDAQGRVERVDQVLTVQQFARIQPQSWTMQQVRDTFGVPADERNIRGHRVWDYRYMELDVYYSLFTVTFDDAGRVLKTENGPDPLHDPGGHGGDGRR